MPYTLQTRSDAPQKDHSSRTPAEAVEAATSLNSRPVDLVVLVVNVYVAPSGLVLSRGAGAKIWTARIVANETSRGQTRTPFGR